MVARRKGSLEAIGSLIGKVYPSHEPEEARALRVDRIGHAAWRRLFEERPDLQPPPGLHMAVYEE